jgi:hypothetical protein
VNKYIISGIVILAFALLAPQIAEAQGTITYLSNLGQTASGSSSVGSDSWFAADFITGTNAGGYTLNSVQLAMTDASGNPSGFTVMLFGKGSQLGTVLPGSSLGSMSGSASPTSAGTYTYTAPANLELSPDTHYFVVLTAGTTVANDAFAWSDTSIASPGYNSYHWGGEVSFAQSSDGLNWNFTSGTYGQFALNATAVPEPSSFFLISLGSGMFLLVRRKNILTSSLR